MRSQQSMHTSGTVTLRFCRSGRRADHWQAGEWATGVGEVGNVEDGGRAGGLLGAVQDVVQGGGGCKGMPTPLLNII